MIGLFEGGGRATFEAYHTPALGCFCPGTLYIAAGGREFASGPAYRGSFHVWHPFKLDAYLKDRANFGRQPALCSIEHDATEGGLSPRHHVVSTLPSAQPQ